MVKFDSPNTILHFSLVASLFALSFSLYCDDNSTYVFIGAGSVAARDLIVQSASSYGLNRSTAASVRDSVQFSVSASSVVKNKLQGIVQPLTLFGASENFFAGDKISDPWLAVPIFGEAIVIYYNLPELSEALNLSLDVVADIYLGNIEFWNDSAIQALNPNANLPSQSIIVMARQDETGLTRVFTGALSMYNKQWNSTYGEFNDPKFPGGICCNSTVWNASIIDFYGRGELGMSGMVLSFTYSIGYGSIVQATTNNNTYAFLKNRAGKIINASATSIYEAMAYWSSVYPNKTSYRLLDAPTPGAYPLATYHYFLINLDTIGNFSCCLQFEFMGYLDYLMFTWTAQQTQNYGLVKAIDTVNLAAYYALMGVQCGGESIYELFVELIRAQPLLTNGQLAAVVICAIFFVGGLCAGFFYMWRKTVSDERIWLISSKALDLAQILRQSVSSLSSTASRSHSESISTGKTSKTSGKEVRSAAADRVRFPVPRTVFEERTVIMLEMSDINKPPTAWKKDTKASLFRLCQRVSHSSVAHLFGVTVVGSKVFAIQEFCSKGTLHYVLKTSRYEFSDTIRMSMAIDVADAMAYLHAKGIIHGKLNSYSCYVSSSWFVKVTNWMVNTITDKENPGYLFSSLIGFDKDDLRDEAQLIELIYIHPGIRKTRKATAVCDVFSYGFLLIEILNRNIPYYTEVSEKRQSYRKLLRNKFQLEAVLTPEIHTAHPSAILERLSKSCLIEEVNSFDALLRELMTQNTIQSGGITDMLMETMETMITNLEKKSAELGKMTAKMKDILNQVLPPSIAEKFIDGQTVEPEYFESASIYFSDIVGFMDICKRSSPLEVMTFLNDLWIAFDAVIERFDCYKADTIGDSYMVCSGLPKRNGLLHVKNIADLALALLERTSMFVIRHLPGEQMRIRIGLNSGPVTAGVVGSKMPQYCVFGDSVNTAARMESTGVAGKIQASEAMARLLTMHFPQYKLERRGEIEVKGKGLMSTFWLEPTLAYHYGDQPRTFVTFGEEEKVSDGITNIE